MTLRSTYKIIIQKAWNEYGHRSSISKIKDISINVSTNNVFIITLENNKKIIAKISDYGYFNHFLEDHIIINSLSLNLSEPFENFLAKSLTKNGSLFTFNYENKNFKIWVVFYNPIKIKKKPNKVQTKNNIKILGGELAKFHLACKDVSNTLPQNFKKTRDDIKKLQSDLKNKYKHEFSKKQNNLILSQCEIYLENYLTLKEKTEPSIPVFIDWNIGNFSLTKDYKFFSRWDYDWFRIGTRILDFYFFSRVCSSKGDKTFFSYLPNTLNEDRFIIFLKSYHKVYPLNKSEVLMLKEMYRFFILNYVIKDGKLFFHSKLAKRLTEESFEFYIPIIENSFEENKILDSLHI
jgi:hypothetical protein